jgi:hypothetical protein
MSLTSQRQWLGATSTGLTGLKLCHDWLCGAAGGEIDFEGLEDDGQMASEYARCSLHIGPHELLRLTDDSCVNVDGGGMGNARLPGGEHDGDAGVAFSVKSVSWAWYCFSSAAMVQTRK